MNWPLRQLLSYWLYAAVYSNSCFPLIHFSDLHFSLSSTPPISRPCDQSLPWQSHCLHPTSCLLFSLHPLSLKQCPRGLRCSACNVAPVDIEPNLPPQRLYRTVFTAHIICLMFSSPCHFISSTQNQDPFHYLWPPTSSLLYSVNFSITTRTILFRPIDFSMPCRWQQAD